MPPPLALAVEIGGTKLQLALGRGDGSLDALERRAVDPARGAEAIRAQIVGAIPALLAQIGACPAEIMAAGIGFGGPVDTSRGTVTLSHHVHGWEGFPLASWMTETFSIPRVVLENDSDAAALGEATFGAGKGMDPVLYTNSGSGIGGGLIVGGRVYRGSGHGALEIGHVRIDAPDDGAAPPTILESVASGWGIASEARRLAGRGEAPALLAASRGSIGRITAESVVADAGANPDGAGALILRRATRAVGAALATAVTLLAPRRVVLGGGVSLMPAEWWLEPIRREVEARVFPPFRGTYDIVLADLGESVVLHGALAAALGGEAQ